MSRKLVAELIGTFILVFFGAGSAIFAINAAEGAPPAIGMLGVALTFGLTLLVLVYAIGPISGCHVNPAVPVGVLLNKGIDAATAGGYMVAQIIGAAVAGLLLKLLTISTIGGVEDQTGGLGTNGWEEPVTVGGAFITEVVLTFLLVFVVLQVTSREGSEANPGFQGLAIGGALAVIHLVGIPVTGTSVNPARSFLLTVNQGISSSLPPHMMPSIYPYDRTFSLLLSKNQWHVVQ
jgi:aquaporin Z